MTRRCACHPDDQPPRWPYRESIWLEYVCLMAGVLAVVVVLAVVR